MHPSHVRVLLAAVLTSALVVAVAPGLGALADTTAKPAAKTTAKTTAKPATKTLTVGSVTLTPCDVVPDAWCGSIKRVWDPTGAVAGSLSVGFAYVPASDTSQPAVGTLVPHEGGPGYSTTGTGVDYIGMYGALLHRRNLLLVDQRGTGLSAPINCPSLQKLTGAYAPAAATCAKKLGSKFDLYGSALSADDLSAVISALALGPVDLYGDSYGTFFAQVFLGRHPSQLRSVVLDSAYPTYSEDAWYATQGPAMRTSLEKVCARTPKCKAVGGSTLHRLTRLLDAVRAKPMHAKATGADGKRHKVTINARELVSVAFGATFTQAIYREFEPAVRAALHGDAAPMARLVAEDDFVGGTGPADEYSEGLDAAVSCQDYPQLYDMTAPPATRLDQFAAAFHAEQTSHPNVYGPFTIKEYLASDWEEQDWCTQWPVADPAHRSTPPLPPSGHYAAVPTMILSGELDSITTPAEGAIVASQIPGSRQVLVANSVHVTATDDTDGCGRALVQAFVAHPTAALPASALTCARTVPPVRGAPSYSKSFRANGTGTERSRAARTATLTVADAMDRWLESIEGDGTGLRGGTWTSGGDHRVTLHLKGYRLASNLAVTGKVVWMRYAKTVSVTLKVVQLNSKGHVVQGSSVSGTLSGHWKTRAAKAPVHLHGKLGGHHVTYTFRAP
jgi:pimeloyl-ACP methyl ester carboxylesterase